VAYSLLQSIQEVRRLKLMMLRNRRISLKISLESDYLPCTRATALASACNSRGVHADPSRSPVRNGGQLCGVTGSGTSRRRVIARPSYHSTYPCRYFHNSSSVHRPGSLRLPPASSKAKQWLQTRARFLEVTCMTFWCPIYLHMSPF